MIRIVLTGGGTGGHLFPLVAVSRKFNELANAQNFGNPEIYYLGPGLFLESSLAREEMNFHYKILITGKLRRYFSFRNFIDFFKAVFGIIHALWEMWKIMPDAIFSKGGYGSIGVVIAGWLYRIPIIIHDSDSIPGLTNKILSRFATFVAVAWSAIFSRRKNILYRRVNKRCFFSNTAAGGRTRRIAFNFAKTGDVNFRRIARSPKNK